MRRFPRPAPASGTSPERETPVARVRGERKATGPRVLPPAVRSLGRAPQSGPASTGEGPASPSWSLKSSSRSSGTPLPPPTAFLQDWGGILSTPEYGRGQRVEATGWPSSSWLEKSRVAAVHRRGPIRFQIPPSPPSNSLNQQDLRSHSKGVVFLLCSRSRA